MFIPCTILTKMVNESITIVTSLHGLIYIYLIYNCSWFDHFGCLLSVFESLPLHVAILPPTFGNNILFRTQLFLHFLCQYPPIKCTCSMAFPETNSLYKSLCEITMPTTMHTGKDWSRPYVSFSYERSVSQDDPCLILPVQQYTERRLYMLISIDNHS